MSSYYCVLTAGQRQKHSQSGKVDPPLVFTKENETATIKRQGIGSCTADDADLRQKWNGWGSVIGAGP